ncbi:MAG: carbamate kinase [Desulfobacteraceae bacterium]|jgi:carbamate kinase
MSPATGISPKSTLIVALGGNALIRKGQPGTIVEQFDNLRIPVRQIASLIPEYNIIITHGNGPQVGNLMLQQECCRAVPKLPLEILVAQTQGQIGYMIESVLDEALMDQGAGFIPLVSLITYVVVDKDDPAFADPSKPIGPGFSEAEAAHLGYPTVKTPKGYRRVVASPKPVTIIEKREIDRLIHSGFVVICCGGGGIPVVRKGRAFAGVDAVIDKDLASALLAVEVHADLLVIATDVEGVMIDFGTPRQRRVEALDIGQAEALLHSGVAGRGSMAPKLEAAIQFLKSGGRRVVITSIAGIVDGVRGSAGTQIVASAAPA